VNESVNLEVYREDSMSFGLPYRQRLLYYDIDLKVWTKLDPAGDLLCMGKWYRQQSILALRPSLSFN